MESKNISNRILSQIYVGINILGILFSLLFGVIGGSGGETTEGVFFGFFYTSILSVISLIIITFIKLSWWKLNVIWAFLPFIIYVPIDKIILEKVFSSEIFRKTKIFFKSIYNVDPVLQQSPLIVITKPSFDENEMRTSYKIPADYHTDYPTEMALHIPLNDLKEGVIHTVYCKSSNRNIFIKSTSKYSENFTNKFKKINLVSKRGAGILLDTQGIHKANVKKANIRIMLFFKFSSKNNIIKNVNYTESSFSAKKSSYFKFDKEKLMIDKNYSTVLGLEKKQIEIFDYFMI